MRVTICQLPYDSQKRRQAWDGLVVHVREAQSDLVLLPEMPFYPWPFWRDSFDRVVWEAAVAAHEQWLGWLAEMAPAAVAATRPVVRDGARYNEGFIWDTEHGLRSTHTKYYLPDEDGFWEGRWYARGDGSFTPFAVSEGQAGFLICTELWFMERARDYGRAGVQLLLTPRATERATVDKWLAGGRVAAVIAGAYCFSSNQISGEGDPISLGGQGWAVDPDGGVLALTSDAQPFATVEVDLALAKEARSTYPRYVAD